MKLILSRKGFDSSAGGKPSPIFPDGSLLSLPIPERIESPITYEKIHFPHVSVPTLVEHLTRGRVEGGTVTHLDPDLRADALPRKRGWRPLFGQTGAAQRHLSNEGIGVGDLFLFFGWFREVEQRHGRWTYARGAPDLHVLFGYLQVGEVLPANRTGVEAYPWASYHPHLHGDRGRNNTLYIARERLHLGGREYGSPGGGVFRHYRECLRLTAPGRNRSCWRLPGWMYPGEGLPPLTYHPGASCWSRIDSHVLLQSTGRGQEFVLHADAYPEAEGWARDLISGD